MTLENKHQRHLQDTLIPKSAKLAFQMLGMRIDEPSSYSLSRSKFGTIVWLHCGILTVNITHHLKHLPKNYSAARKWISEIEDKFGLVLRERPKRCIGRANLKLVKQ